MLTFFAVNKQLDLQTLLIESGREAIVAVGLGTHRRLVQWLFALGLAGCLTLGARWVARRGREPWCGRRSLRTGLVLLAVFVAVRAAHLCHVGELLRIRFHDEEFGWMLELAASACLGWSAFVALRRSDISADSMGSRNQTTAP